MKIEEDKGVKDQAGEGLSLKSQRTRSRLISTATKMMVDVGIGAVSVSAVAKDAGITRTGAYYHFKNREELLQVVKEEFDHQLIRIMGGEKEIADVYSFPANLAAEDEDLVRLRITQMLELGPDKDALIKARKKIFAKNKKLGRLQAGVDDEIVAIITSTSIVAALLTVAGAKTKKKRHHLAKMFGQTYYQLLFFGFLKPESIDSWSDFPEYPSLSNAVKPELSPVLTERSEHTRMQLLTAAIKLLVHIGEEALSISEVTRLAGVTRPGAYYYFKDKSELLAAVKEELDGELLRSIDESFIYNNPSEIINRFVEEDRDLMYLRAQRMLESPETDTFINYYKKVFDWHKKQGNLREGVDQDIAAVIVSVVTLMSSVLAASEFEKGSKEEKQKLAKRFGKTYSKLLFFGVLDKNATDWPAAPELG